MTPWKNHYPMAQCLEYEMDARDVTDCDASAFQFDSGCTETVARVFPFSGNQHRNAGWKYGKGLVLISIKEEKNRAFLTNIQQGVIRTFEAVGTAFEVVVEMQVGICFGM
mmetsp:Transcript_23733/g.65950  ORF Transcript_23733/g.65950 Transcript_23733/m.65950 type:complete len:110 (-) Transcript_23733:131-460(-)